MVGENYILRNKKAISEGIEAYLASEKFFDYESFIKTREHTLKDVKQAAAFAYKYLGETKYCQFMEKALPFEPYFDGSNIVEKEELKKKVSELAVNVKLRKANLIDIIDCGFTNLHQYLAMVKQLAFLYRCVPSSTYITNSEYLNAVARYDQKDLKDTITFEKIGEETEKEIAEVIASRGLLTNAITEAAAYYYLKRKKEQNNKR